ncbi:monofunctional biosynthetic peptidoglycan transglycosylase [bacterium]|nr:monofunctional biosynthetic peptidoglycan transglycosylase [bacterium]
MIFKNWRIKLWIFSILALLTLAVIGLYGTYSLPDVSHLRTINPTSTAFMGNDSKEIKIKWVKLNEIPDNLKRAIIVAEDSNFYRHPGFNWKEILRAARRNWEAGKVIRGGSTITQQLAKNLYLSPKKTTWRKIKELLISLKLERELSKDRILEIYVNVIHWGAGRYGIANASKFYFNTTPDKLTKEQAVYLAAIIPNPDYYRTKPQSAEKKVKHLLSKL